MVTKKYIVNFEVEEHDHREVTTVSVDTEKLEDGVSPHEQAVVNASERTPYTHAETKKIEEKTD